jgi:hypothetical protein
LKDNVAIAAVLLIADEKQFLYAKG